MDGSKVHPLMTAGLDIGDKYSYLCLLDSESGEVIEEGRLSTTPEAFRRRFASEQPPMRIEPPRRLDKQCLLIEVRITPVLCR
jgi:hypothetical protein